MNNDIKLLPKPQPNIHDVMDEIRHGTTAPRELVYFGTGRGKSLYPKYLKLRQQRVAGMQHISDSDYTPIPTVENQ